MSSINESHIEQQCLFWFRDLGYNITNNQDILHSDRAYSTSYKKQAVLLDILRNTLERLNPHLHADAIDEAYQKVLDLVDTPCLIIRNRIAHEYMTTGIKLTHVIDNEERGDIARIIDFNDPQNNDFRVINQVCMVGLEKRRPDVVVYLNGLPVSVIELKNPSDEHATLEKAYNQMETYKRQIPDIFSCNVVNVLSDGYYTLCGSLTANFKRFAPWKKCEDNGKKDPYEWGLCTLIKGLFTKALFIDYLKYFVLFEEATPGQIIKKIAGYHQFYGVRKAVKASVQALQERTRKCGVFWHTQGSGKSISMICYVAKLRQHPAMKNPSVVVVTDRRDLDDQLYTSFTMSQKLVGTVVQANSREEVRAYLNARLSGGVLFTTIQKFALNEHETTFPTLNTRDNIIVITDEAHRSQYGHIMRYKNTGDGKYTYGYSKHMRDALPNAGFIGFTGTPIDITDKSTKEVFGDYVDIYDITDAVDDGVTVNIYYENRFVTLRPSDDIADIDKKIDEALKNETTENAEHEKSEWSTIAAVAGASQRVAKIAKDITKHFQERQAELRGKAMIVAMSRDNCVTIYDALVALHPTWHNSDVNKGNIKIVMTSVADDSDILKEHKYTSQSLKTIEKRFKDPDDPLHIVIVRDMWLTGFDVPCLNTLYIDKPMHGHTLMQAIARVNRVFKNKPSGLVVDYIGIANKLQEATKNYTRSGGKGHTAIDTSEAIKICIDQVDVCREILKDIDYQAFATAPMDTIAKVSDYLKDPQQQSKKKRFCDAVVVCQGAYTLCGTDERIATLAKEITFYRAVKSVVIKGSEAHTMSHADKEAFMRILLDGAVQAKGEIFDLGELIGIGGRKQISIFDNAVLEQMKHSKVPNLALELLNRLLRQALKARFKTDIVQQKAFSQRITETMQKMNEQAITTAEAIEELINIANEVIEEEKLGERLRLTAEEHAFYSAICQNKSAVEHMEEPVLVALARELRKELAKSVTTDWTKRDNIKAEIRIKIKRLLRKYKYPPDNSTQAIEIVLQQAVAIGEGWEQ